MSIRNNLDRTRFVVQAQAEMEFERFMETAEDNRAQHYVLRKMIVQNEDEFDELMLDREQRLQAIEEMMENEGENE